MKKIFRSNNYYIFKPFEAHGKKIKITLNIKKTFRDLEGYRL